YAHTAARARGARPVPRTCAKGAGASGRRPDQLAGIGCPAPARPDNPSDIRLEPLGLRQRIEPCGLAGHRLEQQLCEAAATLPERRTQRKALQRFDIVATQQATRDLGGFPLAMAAADPAAQALA